MTVYAVLRVAKVRTLAALAGASAHNARTAHAGLDHADNQAPLMGGGVRLIAGREDAVEAWRERMRQTGADKRRLRRDAVRAVEIVMSASPAWFAAASPAEREVWASRSLAWATERVGMDNVLSAHLHDDEEGAPHLHLLAVPLTRKARRRAGRPRKGRPRPQEPLEPSWGLSANDFIGGSAAQLAQLQTDYAEAVADLGIRRGRPRRTTGARHQSAHAYRAEAAEEAEEVRRAALEDAEKLMTAGRRQGESLTARTAEALTMAYDAIDAEELVYRPPSAERPEGLALRRKRGRSSLPSQGPAWKDFATLVRPYAARLIGYARRLSALAHREAALAAREAALERREAKAAREISVAHRALVARRTAEIAAFGKEDPETRRDREYLGSIASPQNNSRNRD